MHVKVTDKRQIKSQAKSILAKHNGNEDKAIEEIAFNMVHYMKKGDEETSIFWVKVAKAMCDNEK